MILFASLSTEVEGGFFSAANDNCVAILLIYETARVFLTSREQGQGRKRVFGEWPLHEALKGYQRSEPTQSESRFRALLTECGAPDPEMALV